MIKFINRKNISLASLFLILLGGIITITLVKIGNPFQIKAGPDQDPKNVKITNVSDSSFSVSYLTTAKVIGTVNYGTSENNLDSLALDQRDQISQKVGKYTSHLISINNLEPNKEYYFSITSGDKKYLNGNKSYKAKTGPIISKNPSLQAPVSGRVTLPNGSFPNEGLVFLKTNSSQNISALIKEDGTYLIPLNTIRNSTNEDYFEFKKETMISLDLFAENLFTSVSVGLNDINPVPLITISESYDFTQNISPTPTISRKQTSGFPKFSDKDKSTKPTITITNQR